MRFVFGVLLVALCIYVFYLGLAHKNTPALFADVGYISAQSYKYSEAELAGFTVRLPEGSRYDELPDGIYFYSRSLRIRGNVRVLDELPAGQQWRRQLQRPFSRFFLGDISGLDDFSLIVAVLEHKYNPSLMGHKAAVLPSWMIKSDEALIHADEENQILLFHVPGRFSGIVFAAGRVIAVNVEGHLEPGAAVYLLSSIAPAD